MVYTDNDDDITDTRYKLEEATYFLDQACMNQNNWKIFGFNMDAFFSSTASVREVMRTEFQHTRDFNNWAKQANQSFENQFPRSFWIKTRNQIIHNKGNIRKKVVTSISATLGIEIKGKDWCTFIARMILSSNTAGGLLAISSSQLINANNILMLWL